jgi:hypothetical protein
MEAAGKGKLITRDENPAIVNVCLVRVSDGCEDSVPKRLRVLLCQKNLLSCPTLLDFSFIIME